MWLMIASSISSPPTRSDCETTIPPSEITATSVVPPPMSTIMFPVGSATGRPAPIAAAIGSSIRYALRAPADSVASSTARFSTPVTPDGTHPREPVLVHLLDEVAQHLLRDVEVGDDAVLERPDRADRAGRATEHPFCLEADRVHLARPLVDRHDRRLGENDPAAAHVHERVRRTEVDRHVAAAEAREIREGAHPSRPAPTLDDRFRCERTRGARPSGTDQLALSAAALVLALGSAALHAVWNLLLGRARDVAAATAATFLVSTAVALPFALVWWHARSSVWPYALASTLLETVYVAALALSYGRSEMSFVYPATRGLAPVAALAFAVAWLGHRASAAEVGGVVLVGAGVLLARGGALSGGAPTLLLTATLAATIAAYTLVDRVGIHRAGALTYFVLTLAGPCPALPAPRGTPRDPPRARLGGRRRCAREPRLVRAGPARAPARERGRGAGGAVVVSRARHRRRPPRARGARLLAARRRRRARVRGDRAARALTAHGRRGPRARAARRRGTRRSARRRAPLRRRRPARSDRAPPRRRTRRRRRRRRAPRRR